MLRHRPVLLFFVVLIAFGLGALGGLEVAQLLGPPGATGPKVPMPHHVPTAPDAAGFRFAMVHDVLHQRFPKHGPAFYTERDRRARAKLATLTPDSDEAIALHDDIAAGLDRLGKSAEAVAVMEKKQQLQKARGISGLGTYATSANLGSFLIHVHMPKALAGDPDGRAGVNDGLRHLKDALQVNPNAHFGRETWQVEIIEFLRDASGVTAMLKEHDFLGNRLNRDLSGATFRRGVPAVVSPDVFGRRYGRPFTDGFATHVARRFRAELLATNGDPAAIDPTAAAELRKCITKIGDEWDDKVETASDHKSKSVPFDEPMLGVVGMWRQGDGANVHFALAIGETMLRVGQRELAWSGYERAKRLADGYSPNPDRVKFLRDHCDQRQAFIVGTLSAGECSGWRARFDAELAFGEIYQREMQQYEATKIAAGGDVYDSAFLDDFHKGREPISTPPGDEEYVRLEPTVLYWRLEMVLATGLFVAGLTAFLLTRRRDGVQPALPR